MIIVLYYYVIIIIMIGKSLSTFNFLWHKVLQAYGGIWSRRRQAQRRQAYGRKTPGRKVDKPGRMSTLLTRLAESRQKQNISVLL